MTALAPRTGLDGPVQLAVEGTPTFHTFEAIEIAHVGMDWPASTGPVTFTFEHLAAAVDAATNDPHVLPPRLKIGHVDPRFNEDPPATDPFVYHGPLREDGNPVYGKVINLRLTEDGMVLLGDYVEVPGWLAASLPSAYPSRSLEGDFDVESPPAFTIEGQLVEGEFDVQTEGGKKYGFVITAVSLLGESLPAITCLEDLVRELTGGPAAVAAQTAVTLERSAMTAVAAEASVDSLRSQFFDEFAQGDRFWWWPCEIRVDQALILADDDEGHLYQVPVSVDANGVATFGDPVRGVLDFREVPDDEASEPVAASRAVFASARAARPKDRVRASDKPKKGAAMQIPTAVLDKLDLAEDATEEEILAKLEEIETATPAAEGAPEVEPVAEPVAASIDPPVLAQLQEDARLGREARDQQIATERKTIVDERVAGGFITAASAPAHLAELEKGGEIETTHRTYLAALTAAIVPVGERGGNPSDTTTATQLDQVRASFNLKSRKES